MNREEIKKVICSKSRKEWEHAEKMGVSENQTDKNSFVPKLERKTIPVQSGAGFNF